MKAPRKLVSFDLDGTLVDTLPDLAWCADEMMRQLGKAPNGIESSRHWIGNGVERFVKRSLTGKMNSEPDRDLFVAGLNIFESLYAKHTYEFSQVYAGVVESLTLLSNSGHVLACITNKAGYYTNRILKGLNLDMYFDLVVSGDTTPKKKPHPLPLLHAAEYFSESPSNCMMVGDSKNDVLAARAAGFSVVCVTYGYNHGEDISEAGADQVVSDIRQIRFEK